MHRMGSHIKKIITTILLACLVFILAEKSGHGHPLTHKESQQGQAVIHSGQYCLICEFQFPVADPDIPETGILPLPAMIAIYPVENADRVPQQIIRSFSERGPPACA